ncbi:MAG: hypothetical protein U1F61_26110 [Opitutaceae bacterium]
MPPLLKRKTEKSTAPLVPAWHPNFRNFQRLPDTKAVRTSFFLNGIAAVVTISLLLVLAYQEYSLMQLRTEVDEAQARIEKDQRPSNEAVALYKKFQEEEKKILEVDAFMKSKVAFSDLLVDVGRTLRDRIALQGISSRDNGVIIRGLVRGAGDRGSGEVSAYVESLKKDAAFGKIFESIAQTSIARDPQSGRMTFELFLKFKSAPAPAKK